MVVVDFPYKINKIRVFKYKSKELKPKNLRGDFLSDIDFTTKICTTIDYDWFQSKKIPNYYYCLPQLTCDDTEEICSDMLGVARDFFTMNRYDKVCDVMKNSGWM